MLLSETHWNDYTNVQFSSYNVIKKDRSGRRGGGVATLIHKYLKFTH